MSQSIDNIPGVAENSNKVAALEQRRCVLLAILAATPSNNESLHRILSNGLLTSLRPWLDDILTGTVGGVDFLLYFLSSIASLPVTKSQVRDSGMGKKVGSVDKHKICAGTLNESAIKARVQTVKDSWNASVKALKELDTSPVNNKRVLDLPTTNGIAKKAKTDTFSDLMKKVAPVPRSKPASKPAMSIKSLMAPSMESTPPTTTESAPQAKPKKSSNKRVKWSDHFGGSLEHAREIEGNRGEQPVNAEADKDALVSWSDRSKRDRLREKELFAEAKKKKLTDDDDFDIFSPAMRATTSWREAPVTPERTDVTKAVVESKEIITQVARMASVSAVRYVSENLVPSSPAQMTDVETALDMQAVQSSVPMPIPFFVPQEVPVPVPAPIAIPTLPIPVAAPYGAASYGAPYASAYPPPPPPPPASIGATVEMVQAMGLPLFLVGSNVQALQTIASNPSLLNTFVDANGMYDQQNLMALVQTLGQSMPNAVQQPAVQAYSTSYGQMQIPQQTYGRTPPSAYGPAATAPVATYGQPASSHYGPGSAAAAPVASYRGDKNTEANLHMAGYGPTTTQADIIALFSPYVRVKEVVMKNGFCFVNTNDVAGAQNAKENLTGALLGGMPIRINMAQRRDRESVPPPAASIYGRGGGAGLSSGVVPGMGMVQQQQPPVAAMSAPPIQPALGMGQIDVNSVRDDRGNPATKNLFVAGYGPSTTEAEIRNLFGQHAIITGCVLKGNFAFVNTGDRMAAVTARAALSGTVLNGGVLRINFAKETGRLGTSFDLTYNAASSVGPGGGPQRSYYGR
ncbi:TFIIS helical bundle-like domain [Fragilaria crotonensis]|nr:TFIIS helical bundle-like domain [Fragilaria crotonensis]